MKVLSKESVRNKQLKKENNNLKRELFTLQSAIYAENKQLVVILNNLEKRIEQLEKRIGKENLTETVKKLVIGGN